MEENNDNTSCGTKLVLFGLYYLTILVPMIISKGASVGTFFVALMTALLGVLLFIIFKSNVG